MAIWLGAVSMGGSNELVECFCGGAVAEGYSGAVARLVGDGVEVGLAAGDGGSHVSVRIAPSGRPWMRRVSVTDLVGPAPQRQGHV